MQATSLSFGRYSGVPLPDVPQNYLRWLAARDLNLELRVLVASELACRESSGRADIMRQLDLMYEYEWRGRAFAQSFEGKTADDREYRDLCKAYLDRAMLWDFSCWICGGEWEAADHVIPRSKRRFSGDRPWLDSPANFRPICHHCNSRKGHRPASWAKPEGAFHGVVGERIADAWGIIARRARRAA